MYISEDDKKKILDVTSGKLVETIHQFTALTRKGGSADYYGICPICGSDKFGIPQKVFSAAINASNCRERHR